jgi:hypothetical protein
MKAFVIIEYEYYPESPDFKILGVVDSEEKAKELYNQLTESAKEFNKEQSLYEVSYDYEAFDINDLSTIEKRIQFNNNGRNWRKE